MSGYLDLAKRASTNFSSETSREELPREGAASWRKLTGVVWWSGGASIQVG